MQQIHIKSSNPYVEPFFDSGFLNNKADVAPIRWSYKKTREIARRMDGKLTLELRTFIAYVYSFQHTVAS